MGLIRRLAARVAALFLKREPSTPSCQARGGPYRTPPSAASLEKLSRPFPPEEPCEGEAHLAPEKLFGKVPTSQLETLERAHLARCKDCFTLHMVKGDAVSISDRLATREPPAPPKPPTALWMYLGAALSIWRAGFAAYAPLLARPGQWRRLIAGVVSLVGWTLKSLLHAFPLGPVLKIFAGVGAALLWLLAWPLRRLFHDYFKRPRPPWHPDAWRETEPPSGLQEAFLGAYEREAAAQEVFAGWASELSATLRNQLTPRYKPSNRAPSRYGLYRVFFQGDDGLPIAALCRMRPKNEKKRDLLIFVPPFLVPAEIPSLMGAARHLFETTKVHVVIVDPRGSGVSQWGAPGHRMTGGDLEGKDVALLLEQLKEQLKGRLGAVKLVGLMQGGTTALWGLYHAETRQKIRIDQVVVRSPVVHLGMVLRHLEPRRPLQCLRWADPCFEVRAFFKLLVDLRLTFWGDLGNHVRTMADYLDAVGVEAADLGVISHEDPRTPAEGTGGARGDLLVASEVLRKALREGRLFISDAEGPNPLIPSWHTERLSNALKITPKKEGAPGQSGLGVVVDDLQAHKVLKQAHLRECAQDKALVGQALDQGEVKAPVALHEIEDGRMKGLKHESCPNFEAWCIAAGTRNRGKNAVG